MKTRTLHGVVYMAAVLFAACPANAQLVRIGFSSEVTQIIGGPLLEGVAVGSVISGQIQVDLAHLPQDYALGPSFGGYSYVGGSHPGYTFQFNTGLQTFTLDSVNAANGVGINPEISQIKAGDADVLDFAARDQGNPFGVLLRFADYTDPFTLLSGDYFPEDVNLPEGLANATFTYSDFIYPDAVIAKVTAASITIEQETPAAMLIFRVNASNLPAQRKRPLLATLESADAAFAQGQCAKALHLLQTFQSKVRAQVQSVDPILSDHLIAGSQALIDAGCAD